jgi:hypothetical protein
MIFSGTKPSETGIVEIVEHVHHHVQQICHDTGTEPGTLDTYKDAIIDSVGNSIWQPRWKEETKVKKVLEEGVDYWNFLVEAQGSHILTEVEKTALEGMLNSLHSSIYQEEILNFSGDKEVPILGTYSVNLGDATGTVPIKALLDMLHVHGSDATVDEIKTTGKAAAHFMGHTRVGLHSDGEVGLKWFDGAFQTFRYYRQLAFYAMIVRQHFEIKNVHHNIYVFETTEPYEIRKFEHMNSAYWSYAEREIALCMQQIAKYIRRYVVEDF